MGQQCSHKVQEVQQVIDHTLFQPSSEEVKIQIQLMRHKNKHLINFAQKYTSPQNNQQFFGYIQNGFKQGYGQLKAAQDRRYYGYFKDNLPHIKGVLIFQNDHYYIGQFYNGKMEGIGKQVSPYFTFEGQYFNDRKKHGRLQTQEFIYQGSFQQQSNNFGGYGQLKYKNGQKYIGNFKKGEFEGQGMYFGPTNNLIYQGQFKNNLYHGRGKYYWDDGSFYQGQYFRGVKQGQGKYFKSGSQVIQGKWEKGILVCRFKNKQINKQKQIKDEIKNNASNFSTKMYRSTIFKGYNIEISLYLDD